ncbi:MAG: toll/interleukin-1 receptor domain-containing protein [Saprospiraceae bacterium]
MKDITPVKLFYLYSEKDTKYLEQLVSHFSPLRKKNIIEDWYESEMAAGEEFQTVIFEKLNNAHIVLFLVSADFISSKYCQDGEVLFSLEKEKEGKCKIILIILRACLWEETNFSHFQALPNDKKPIASLSEIKIDEIFEEIVKDLKEIIYNIYQEINTSVVANIYDDTIIITLIIKQIEPIELTIETISGITIHEIINNLTSENDLNELNGYIALNQEKKKLDLKSTLRENNIKDKDVIVLEKPSRAFMPE